MTMPDERYRAVLYAEEFLRAIADPAITKRIPKDIRQRARGVLRHYPNAYDLDQAARAAPDIFAKQMEDVHKFFKRYEESKKNEA